MGRLSKNRGRSYEYRVRDHFRSLEGWNAERNDNSKAKKQIKDTDIESKHDVVAWKEDWSIVLQIECKKTSKAKLALQWEWIEKIDFSNDEILVFATQRTSHYTLTSLQQYEEMVGKITKKHDCLEARGKSQWRTSIDNFDSLVELVWNEQHFVIMELSKFLIQREKFGGKSIKPDQLKNKESNQSIIEHQIICPHCSNTVILNFPITIKHNGEK